MAIVNGYLDKAELKSYLQIGDTADDDELDVAIEAASRLIDEFCGRRFYADGSATAKTFVADDAHRLWLPDFSTTTGLVVASDTTDDGTFDTTWASSDYQVEPLNPENGYPFTSIVAVDTRTFPTGSRRATVQVTAKWGWAEVPKRVKQACAIQAQVEFKRATEGATPIVTMDGATLNGSMFLDRSAARQLHGLQRIDVRGV